MHRSTAAIAYNDQMAMGFMRGLLQRGIRVPEDVSIVGFDNSYGSGLVTPGLTTVESPSYALGSAAVGNLLALARGARFEAHGALVLPTRLVVRGSTGVAPAARGRRSSGRRGPAAQLARS
jgi:LacI family transcriptional regulator